MTIYSPEKVDKPWLKIPGATTEQELDWLNKQARNRTLIYEIGSYLGRSTVALLESGSPVYAVDDFYGSRDEHIPDEERKTIFQRFMENTNGYDNLFTLKINHDQFTPMNHADMVFIDGDHTYESVIRDIMKFKSFKNILICGHDYEWWPPVREAVNWTFGKRVSLVGNNLWYIFQ